MSMHGRGMVSRSFTCTVLSSRMRARRVTQQQVLRHLRVRTRRRTDRRSGAAAVERHAQIRTAGVRPVPSLARQSEQRVLHLGLAMKPRHEISERCRNEFRHEARIPRKATTSGMNARTSRRHHTARRRSRKRSCRRPDAIFTITSRHGQRSSRHGAAFEHHDLVHTERQSGDRHNGFGSLHFERSARGLRDHLAEERLRAARAVRLLHGSGRRPAAPHVHVKTGHVEGQGHPDAGGPRPRHPRPARRRASQHRRLPVRVLHSRHRRAGRGCWFARSPAPTRPEIAHDLRAHLCRCTGYTKIVDAVELFAAARRGESPPAAAVDGRVGSPPAPLSRQASWCSGERPVRRRHPCPECCSRRCVSATTRGRGAGASTPPPARAMPGVAPRAHRGGRAGRAIRRADREGLAGVRRRSARRPAASATCSPSSWRRTADGPPGRRRHRRRLRSPRRRSPTPRRRSAARCPESCIPAAICSARSAIRRGDVEAAFAASAPRGRGHVSRRSASSTCSSSRRRAWRCPIRATGGGRTRPEASSRRARASSTIGGRSHRCSAGPRPRSRGARVATAARSAARRT